MKNVTILMQKVHEEGLENNSSLQWVPNNAGWNNAGASWLMALKEKSLQCSVMTQGWTYSIWKPLRDVKLSTGRRHITGTCIGYIRDCRHTYSSCEQGTNRLVVTHLQQRVGPVHMLVYAFPIPENSVTPGWLPRFLTAGDFQLIL